MILSTPLVWVLLPLIASAVCFVFNQRRIFGFIFASVTSFGLALLAAFFPEDLTFSIGRFNIVFQESLAIFGRRVTLTYSILPFVAFVFGMTGLWLLSSNLPGVPRLFRPISLIITASLTAALGVEPFLYAALLIETAVLVSIPMLLAGKHEVHQGILRYLTIITIGMPFILFAGWLMTGVVTLPPESPLVAQTIIFLGLGFAIGLAVFPFHSWVPMVTHRSNPIASSFLLFILPASILVFGLKFINRYEFIRTSAEVFRVIRVVGAVMVVFGGIWTAIQDDLKRAFGFAALVETGISLLAIGLAPNGGLSLLLMALPARGLGYWFWGYVLTLMENHCDDLKMEAMRDCAKKAPFLSLGLLFAQLSIAGLPMLASFPIKMELFTMAISLNTSLGFWSFVGNLGLFLFSIRLLLNAVANPSEDVNMVRFKIEKTKVYLPILLTIITLALFGLFPNAFLFWLTDLLEAFPQLQ